MLWSLQLHYRCVKVAWCPESVWNRACEWLTPDLAWVCSQEPDVIVYEAKMFKRFGEGGSCWFVGEEGWQNMRR